MTTIAQFIKYLETYPPDTLVCVMRNRDRDYHTKTDWVDIDLNRNSDSVLYLEAHKTIYIGDE